MSWFAITRADQFLRLHVRDEIGWCSDSMRQIGVDELAVELGASVVDEVYIDSCGGVADVGLGAARLLLGRCRTARIRRADSSAGIIALAAERRVIEPGGRFLVHRSRNVTIGNRFAYEAAIGFLDECDEAIMTWLVERTGQPQAVVSEWMARESVFDASESVRLGLAHAVLPEVPSAPPAAAPARVGVGASKVDETVEFLDVLRASGRWMVRDRGALLREFWHWAHSPQVVEIPKP